MSELNLNEVNLHLVLTSHGTNSCVLENEYEILSHMMSSAELLQCACILGDLEIVRQALKSPDVDVNAPSAAYNATPLHLAAKHGSLDTCRLLLQHPGINRHPVDAALIHPVHIAAVEGHIDIVRLFLDQPLQAHAELDRMYLRTFMKDIGIPTDVSHALWEDKLWEFIHTSTKKEKVCRVPFHYVRKLCIRADHAFTLSSMVMALLLNTDRHLIINSPLLLALATELFEASPSTKTLKVAIVYADVTICEKLLELILQMESINKENVYVCYIASVYDSQRKDLVNKQLNLNVKRALEYLINNRAHIHSDSQKQVQNKLMLQAIDFNFGAQMLTLVEQKPERDLDTSILLGLRNSVRDLIYENTPTKFSTFQWHWSLQDLSIFSMICEHSNYTADPRFYTELSYSRKQHLQTGKDNYCILKNESLVNSSEIVFEARRVIDEVTKEDWQSQMMHAKLVVLSLFDNVAKRITPEFHFTPKLVGSSYEGTRNFAPNEFDVLCIIPYKNYAPIEYNSKKMAFTTDSKASDFIDKFYDRLCIALNKVIFKNRSLRSLSQNYAFENNRKLKQFKKVKLLWHEPHGAVVALDIDVIAALECDIKEPVTLRLNFADAPTLLVGQREDPDPIANITFRLPVCVSHIESEFIRQLPREIKHGYKIAKALRSARLFPREVVHNFNMASDLPLDEYVRTYMLKNCLLLVLEKHDMMTPERQAQSMEDALYWADQIYRRLQICLRRGMLPWFFSGDQESALFHCIDVKRKPKLGFDRKCCLRRKFLYKVVTWIRYLIASVRAAEENQSVVGKVLVYSRDTMEHPYDFYSIYKKNARTRQTPGV